VLVLIAVLVACSLERWLRGKTWTVELTPQPRLALAGAALGAVALAIAILFAVPLYEWLTPRSIEWTQTAAVRGNVSAWLMVAILLTAQSIALELVFRRWAIERLLELRVPGLVSAALAAVAQALAVSGSLLSRTGTLLAAFGFGLLYLGAGRRLAPAIACRVTFEIGALTLVALRLLP
jgi:membrane protease YdiL (CAAX protease family)